MSITCNFEKDENEVRRTEKMIVRIAPGQQIGSDTPALKPCVNGAYLWVMEPRRRSGRSWRENSSLN